MNCKTLRDFHIVQADSVSHSRPMSHAAVSPSVIAAVHALRFKMSSTTWPSTAAYPAIPHGRAASDSALESSRCRGADFELHLPRKAPRRSSRPCHPGSPRPWLARGHWLDEGTLSLLVAPDASPWRTSTIDWSTIPEHGT